MGTDSHTFGRRVAVGCGWTLGVCFVAAVFFPVFAQSKGGSKDSCLSHVKQIAMGFLMYADDQDDHFPAASAWIDRLSLYPNNPRIYRCPSVPQGTKGSVGYAMRSKFGGLAREAIKKPEIEPLVFDTEILIRNAHSNSIWVPVFTRHPGPHVGYADGHAKPVPSH